MTWNPSRFTPIVLLIDGQEWTARSFESILSPHGCTVLRAYTGRQGLETLHRMVPDLILVAGHLSDMEAADVLRRLPDVTTVGSSTPRCVIFPTQAKRAERREVLEAGAWEILAPPFDADELLLRFATWIDAKRDVDEAREQGMVDPATGLYNYNGLLRRIDEMASEASRHERHLALIAVGPGGRDGDEEPDQIEVSRVVGDVLNRTARLSDVVARVGPTDFMILAPATDPEGAEMLARRILAANESGTVSLRAGVYSAQRAPHEPITPVDLLTRATAALRRAQSDGTTPVVVQELNAN